MQIGETVDTISHPEERANRTGEAKDFGEILRIVSHELKEPLINLEGYARLLRDESAQNLEEDARGHLDTVVRLSEHTKRLLNDLLSLSGGGGAQGTVEEISVATLLEDVLGEFEFTIRDRRAEVDIQPGLPVIRYDRTQIATVFRNLLSNALKFNESAEPKVEIRAKEEEGWITFEVRDNGVGISPAELEKVFGVIHRADEGVKYPRSGIGLSIVRKTIERHGGKVWVESIPGKGTSVFFTVQD